MIERTVQDDRGVTRPLARAGDLGPGGPPALKVAFKRVSAAHPAKLLLIAILCLNTVLGIFRAFGSPMSAGAWLLHVAAAGLWLAAVIGFVWMLWKKGRPPRDTIKQACLKHARCASCLYDLQDTAPTSAGSDGCTVCPECGAAWRLSSPAHDTPHSTPRGC
jgi:hypothetical protein